MVHNIIQKTHFILPETFSYLVNGRSQMALYLIWMKQNDFKKHENSRMSNFMKMQYSTKICYQKFTNTIKNFPRKRTLQKKRYFKNTRLENIAKLLGLYVNKIIIPSQYWARTIRYLVVGVKPTKQKYMFTSEPDKR